MSQNITLLGASYSDVPSVLLPKTGGGTASFTDVTDTTASANDVAAGKYFYTAAGVKTEGTSTGGGTTAGTVTQDANGYLILDDDAPAGPTLITKSITANGTYNASSDSADGYSSVTVNVSGGGGSSASMSDPIRFFDYDGTLVASYSSVPDSLPSVPTHTGLTGGSWNYTLAQVTTQVNATGTCDIGANYTTASGATEIYIELQAGRLHPYLTLAVNGTVSIDWGDGSTSTSTGTSITTRKTDIHHEYAQAGSYTISVSKTSGTGYSLYCSSTYPLIRSSASSTNPNYVYASCVKSVLVGSDCAVGSSSFYNCYSLAYIALPSGATSIGNNIFYNCYSLAYIALPSSITSVGYTAFQNCYSLQSVSIPLGITTINSATFNSCYSLTSLTIPTGVTSIGYNAFYYCYAMRSIALPSGITTIGYQAFYYCYSLDEVNIPSSVTKIGYGAFNNCRTLASVTLPTNLTTLNDGSSASTTAGCFQSCHSLASLTIPSGCTGFVQNEFKDCYGIGEYHFKATTPPTLANVNCFTNIPSDCKIYVPSASLSDYQTAENWSTYASYMVGE